jgi:hypothetical protein
MQVKKQFEEIYALLEANKNKKVSTLLPELAELMSKKSAGGTNGSTFHKIDDEVVAVYCYYHKKWELISKTEYGKKASNQATGLNTMCKEGVSAWTKQQRMKKLAEQELLTKVSKGEILPEDIASEQEAILKESKLIVPRSDEHGFDLLADALEAL